MFSIFVALVRPRLTRLRWPYFFVIKIWHKVCLFFAVNVIIYVYSTTSAITCNALVYFNVLRNWYMDFQLRLKSSSCIFIWHIWSVTKILVRLLSCVVDRTIRRKTWRCVASKFRNVVEHQDPGPIRNFCRKFDFSHLFGIL